MPSPHRTLPFGEGGATSSSAGVTEVNGQTGVVTLDALSVGADAFGSATGEVFAHESAYDHTKIPSSGEKAALAGTSGTPGSGNKFVTDGDSRLSDARTPSSHNTSHKHGGSDEIATATPAANAIPKADGSGKLDAWITPGAGNATQIQSRAVDSAAPSDGQALAWDSVSSKWKPKTIASSGSVLPHPLHSILSIRGSGLGALNRLSLAANSLLAIGAQAADEIASLAGYAFDDTNKRFAARNAIIPTMTGSTTPSGTASASSEYVGGGYYMYAWKAMDGNLNIGGGWLTNGTPTGWICYEPSSAKIVDEYRIYPTSVLGEVSARNPKNWTFEGWDGGSWITLDTQTNQTSWPFAWKTFKFTNTTAYSKYRLNVSANNGDTYLGVGQIQFYGPDPTDPVSLQPDGVELDGGAGQPTTLALSLVLGDFTLGNLNTDIVASVSRDNGTTWAVVTLSVRSVFKLSPSDTTSVYEVYGAADVSEQSGATHKLRWKLVSTTEKPNLYGAALTGYESL